MNWSYKVFLLLLFTLTAPKSLTWALDSSHVSGITVRADDMYRDFEKKTLTLSGNIQLIVKENHIEAQKAVIYLEEDRLVADGNVVIKNKRYHLEGEKIDFNLKNETGLIHKGFVQSGNVYFEGELIKKTGEKEYYAYNATYTSCTNCPPGWSFGGKEIKAEMGGYANIKLPVFKISNVPVMILPSILVPLKSDRQSGFLVPSIDFSSTSGTGIEESYFWAISRSTDATITAKSYEKRGLKGLLEYRYVHTEDSRGSFHTAFINDKVFKATSNADPDKKQRGFFTYIHRYEMPYDYIHRTKLNYISDLKYPRDFPEEIAGHGNPALENTVSLTKNSHNMHSSIEATIYKNLLKEEAITNNDDAVHRFPEVRYSIIEQDLFDSNIMFSLDLDYTQFTRNGFGYDDVTGTSTSRRVNQVRDGSFDPNNDILRTGHRMILQPTLSFPFQIGKVIDILPSVTYNEAQYRFTAQSDDNDYSQIATRRFFDTNLSMRTKYSRVFGNTSGPDSSYKHEIEPEITFSRIAWVKRPDHIFFGNFEQQPYSRQSSSVSNQDFFGSSKLQFDYYDRVFDKKIINLSLNNNLIRKKWTGSKLQYQNITSFKLQQSYDINELEREDPSPWSSLSAFLDIRLDNFETNTNANYYPYANVTNVFSRVRFKSDSGNFLEFLYAIDFSIDENNEFNYDERTETWGLGMGLNTRYVNVSGQFDYNPVISKVSKWGYIATIKPPGDCWWIQIDHRKNLSADTVFKLNFGFDFGGKS